MAAHTPVSVTVYTQPPEDLITLLRTHHRPYALPLLRRLSFTRFPGGITEHARILFASASGLSPRDHYQHHHHHSAPFAAAYLDLSRGPETEIWLYSSVEALGAGTTTHPSPSHQDQDQEEKVAAAAECAYQLLREVKALREAFYTPGTAHAAAQRQEGLGLRPARILAGTLSEATRVALANRGVAFGYVAVFDKWMFRLGALPDVPSPLEEGEEEGMGMEWRPVRREDIPLMLSRTSIPRKERTIVLLPSMAVYKSDGTPIAWVLLGPDSSLSNLHCEEEWRGRGFAKAAAVKILRERLKEYDDDEHCWADVAPDNPKSQRVCKSLGGKIAWSVSWSGIDLDASFPDR
ncbi:uncharacterized protein F4812DRAFT_460289 [Daldinia caldariorum]|uniref:uncharacterized protein n=1 Tax=Daldinia caldariorum TaxID=326644 RepID=UPI0020089C79|nr:uncharacterized protein F4812DRAFT_460289 [Daldinia caldariorum]KAI1466727.1 hypothetical protein F4812DRAFT_460289 [Daldinia caldariorum]